MPYERINKNSNAQQAKRRGVWVIYSGDRPYQYAPNRETVRAQVLKEYRQMRKALAKKNKEEREAASVSIKSRSNLGGVAN